MMLPSGNRLVVTFFSWCKKINSHTPSLLLLKFLFSVMSVHVQVSDCLLHWGFFTYTSAHFGQQI